MTEWTVRIGMLLAGGLALAGSVRAEDMPGMDMPHPAAHAPADAGYAAAMQGMMKGMAAKPSGDPDRDFAAMMIPHHQGAIDMARVELAHGKDPVLRRLARDVVAAQEKEIAAMKAWLTAHPR